jgi:hypothetical protein
MGKVGKANRGYRHDMHGMNNNKKNDNARPFMGPDRKQSYAEDRTVEKKQQGRDANTSESTVLTVKHRQKLRSNGSI